MDHLPECKPQPTPDHRFLALVIISRDIGAMHTASIVSLDPPSFASELEAASAGWRVGMRWVAENG